MSLHEANLASAFNIVCIFILNEASREAKYHLVISANVYVDSR